MSVLLFALGFFLALAGDSLPMGPLYLALRPDFVALLLLYWAITSATELGLGVAWIIGLVQDVVDGGVLGAHAMAAAVMIFILYAGLGKVRNLPPWEQLFFIFILLLAERLVAWSWQIWGGPIVWNLALLLGPLTGALLWPVFVYLLDRIRHRLRSA